MKRHTDCLRVDLYAAKAKKPFKIYSSICEAAEKRADNMRARTHKTRHGRQKVFTCSKSNSAYTTRGLSNAISAGPRLTIYGSLVASMSRFGRSTFAGEVVK